MSRVLELQQLAPNSSKDEMNLVLVSTFSAMCPTNGPLGEAGFQME
jgi:hypothetical protein